MSRYIDADKVLEKINKICNRCGKMNKNNGVMCGACYFDYAKDMIDDFPTAEVKPIDDGEWIVKGQEVYCSKCNERSSYNRFGASAFTSYCPNCGAKMKESEEEE